MNRYATIDIGSNSVLLWIADKVGKRRFVGFFDGAIITRLGEGLAETGFLKQKAMKRTVEALKVFREKIGESGVNGVSAVGTMALRKAKNREEFLELVKGEIGIEIEVISGEEEAKLSYVGSVSGLGIDSDGVLMVDVGGGSTEIVYGDNVWSLPLGVLDLTERFLRSDPVSRKEINDLVEYLDLELKKVKINGEVEEVVGVGGSAATMSAVKHGLLKYDGDIVHGTRFTIDETVEQMEMYRSKTLTDRRKIVGLEPGRTDTIIAGVAVFYAVLLRFRKDSFVVSNTGLRHGLMLRRFGEL